MSRNLAVPLARLFGAAGMTHLVAPGVYDAIVPTRLPGSPRAWTYASGAAELLVAAAVAAPPTRRLGASAAAVLLVAVFPANLKMALDYRDRGRLVRAAAAARLPMQLPLVGWALLVRARAGRG